MPNYGMGMNMNMMAYPGMDYQQQMMANQMMMGDPNAMLMMMPPMNPEALNMADQNQINNSQSTNNATTGTENK